MRKRHSKELHNPYISSDIIVILTSRMIKWMGHVGQLQDKKCVVSVILWHCQDLDCVASSGRVIDEFESIWLLAIS
jgi:hypothetical protein